MFQPDHDATPLDRAILNMAATMHEAGWKEEAQDIATCATYIREAGRHIASDAPRSTVLDELEALAGGAAEIARLVAKAYPDDIAMRRA